MNPFLVSMSSLAHAARIASCSSDMTIKVWDTNDDWKNVKTLFGHDHTVSAVRFLPGDDFVVSAGRDRTIRVWDIKTGYCTKTLSGHSDWVRSVVPSDDGRLLASCSNDQVSECFSRTSMSSLTDSARSDGTHLGRCKRRDKG